MSEQRQELEPGLVIRKRVQQDPRRGKVSELLLDNNTDNEIEFTVSFKDSQNIRVDAARSSGISQPDRYQIVASLPPQTSSSMCTYGGDDPRQGFRTQCAYSWIRKAPSKAYLQERSKEEEAKVEKMLSKAREADFGADSWSVADLRAQCRVSEP